MSKKFFSVFVSVTTLVAMLGVAPGVTRAATAEELQAQINSLLSMIASLQAQLGTPGSGSMSSYTYTRNLTVGSTGEDVMMLQKLLNANGYKIAESGAGSPGSESTYFGTKTKAALAKWQAANGVSPASGYFGPITRAKVNGSMSGPIGPTGPIVAPSTGLSVSLSANNPRTGALISSSSRVPVLTFNVTAGTSGAATLTDMTFKKEGYISDSGISNAYLLENGKVVAQYNSLSNAMIQFTGMNLGVNAGQTRELMLAIDPAAGLTAGNSVSFSLMTVKAMDSASTMITTSGALPLMGNLFTVTSVTNPSIATLAIVSSTVGGSVYAGTPNVLVSQWTMTGGNSPLNLKSINFKVVGSANKGDIKNVKLMVNGTQVGPTLPQVASDGSAFFSFGATPAKLNTGANNMQVIADIMGSPSFTFQFELLNTYDVEALDSVYNVPVSPTITGGAGTLVTIQQGQLTVNLASDTPTGNIIAGGSNTPFAKFTIYAAGEPVKVKFLSFRLALTGTAGATWDTEIKNVSLTDDAGSQVGSTINSLVTAVTCTDGTFSAATTTATNCFGSSGSPINYTIPANTTRVLTLRGDVQSTAGFTTVVGSLVASTNSNLQGVTSSQTANSGAVTGGSLTRVSSAVTVAQNTAIGTQTFAAGTQNARIGSYTLSASSAEGANLSTLNITMSASGTQYQNLRVLVGGQQFATTYPTPSASTAHSFSGGLINIPAGQSKVVDVYADIQTGASGTHTAITTLSGCTGYGATSFSSISCSSRAGQTVTIGGAPTLVVSTNQTLQSPASHLVANAADRLLGAFQFVETSNNEEVLLKEVHVFQQLPGVAGTSTASSSWTLPSFSNLRLVNVADNAEYSHGGINYSNSTNTVTSSAPGYGYFYKFTLGSGLTVPKGQGGAVNLKLIGNVADVVANGATDNGTHVFRITTSSPDTAIDTAAEVVVATGKFSATSTAITLSSPVSTTSTVLRSKLTVSAAGLGVTTGRVKTGADRFATLTFTADASGGTAVLNSVTMTYAGSAATTTIPSTATGTRLLDASFVDVQTSLGATSSTSALTKTWTFGSGLQIAPGSSYTFTIELNSSAGTVAASGTNSVSLNATINATTDVGYSTAPSGGTSGINLPATAVPIQINTVTYGAGT